MKKYYFVLENYKGDERVSGHAHTLLGVKYIFKKVTNAYKCVVSKRVGRGNNRHYSKTITYQK